jgi:hypothetical protein
MSEEKKNNTKIAAKGAAPAAVETVKNVKGPAVPVVIVPEKEAKPKKERKAAAPKGNFLYKKVGDIKEGEKALPLQCKQIFDIIAANKDGIMREALIAEMTKVVVTRQPQERILGYYQPSLVQRNLVTVTAPAAPAAPAATK